jgi:hypothetical protein
MKESLDNKHQSLLQRFKEIDEIEIPQLREEIEAKQVLLQDATVLLDTKLEIREQLQTLTKRMTELEQTRPNYFMQNARFLFNYFESKKNVDDGHRQPKTSTALDHFFRVKQGAKGLGHDATTAAAATTTTATTTTTTTATAATSRSMESRIYYQRYWMNVNDDLPASDEYVLTADVCVACQQGELIPQEDEGILICNHPSCGRFFTHIVDLNKPSTKDPPNEVSYTAYVKLNHFKEILSQFQAKESTHIPDEVIEKIRARMKKERLTDLSTLNYEKMRDLLKKLGLNRYFEHIQYINSIFGVSPPSMSDELVSTLCVLFIEIQKPWAVHCPPDRSNFFNYTYTLYQLCMLLGQTQYLPYITMLKDREKQLEQDMIWKKVCRDLDWAFFPTV